MPPDPPQLITATFTTSTQTLVLEFDQAMDQTSLPIGNGNLIELNAVGVDRRCRTPLSWLDAMRLSLRTGTPAPIVPADTTRCADTTGIKSALGVAAHSWDEFPLVIVP